VSRGASAIAMLLSFAAFAQSQVEQSALDAARSGAEDAIRRWIRSGANVNARGQGGMTVLLAAAEGNQPAIVRLLIAAGADVNVQDGEGVSALLAASLSAGPGVVRLLLEGGARLAEVPAPLRAGSADLEDSYTPLLYLIVKGQLENVRRMVAAGADPAHEINGRSLAMYASEHDWAAIVELLDSAARPDRAPHGAVRDPFGRGYTPLMVAAAKGDEAEFHRLLKAGADWKGATKSHTTMLMFAAQGGNAAIVGTLLGSGVKGGQPNFAGWTPVMYAAVRGDAVTVEKLLAAGEDPSIPGEDAGVLVLSALTPEVRSLLEKAAGKRQPRPRGGA
jgi:ankyrin repeat protein